jgi:hypothetical protein
MRTAWLSLVAAGLLLAGCQSTTEYRSAANDPEHLHRAVKTLTDVMVHDIFSPPQASRAYAYAGVAAYEALVPSHDSTHQTLAGQLNGLEPVPAPPEKEYLPALASVDAYLTVGHALVFTQSRVADAHDQMLQRFRDMGVPRAVFDRSTAYGNAVAQHILAWAEADGYKESRSAPQFTVVDDDSGRWKPTPPAYLDAIEPNWDTLRPFVMREADQFKPTPPAPFSLDPESRFFQQTQEVYAIGKNLTDEQREIAAFWDCNPYVMHTQGHAMFATKQMTPGGHWMGIAVIANRKTNASLMQSAEAIAQTAVALADGFISAWDEKYRSNLVRPETVINAHIDDSWRPVLQTPPFPEYTSAHSVISAAAATSLRDMYGPSFAFDDTTEVAYGLPVRSFDSFMDAAKEAAISRLYGGIHYRMAAENGTTQGLNVGAWVVQNIEPRVPPTAHMPDAAPSDAAPSDAAATTARGGS